MQQVALQIADSYSRLFTGNKSAHGVHVYGKEKSKKGKREGKSWTEAKPPTDEDYTNHLNGKKGLGIVPIDHNNKVTFCVIDVDDYSEKVESYVNQIYSNNMPLLPFRSKSGGLHLYIFFQNEVSATLAIDTMKKFIALLALKDDTEIFPKQKKLRKGDNGNWINLPYYNLGQPTFGAMQNGLQSELGDILSIEFMIEEVRRKTQTPESLEEFFDNLPLQDAPPCLQAIYMKGDTTHRNDYLFNIACYYKSKYGDSFEQYVVEANSMLVDPLDLKELTATVTRNKGKDYTYKCTQEPICSFCNKIECSKREFGITGMYISQLNFEEFYQYKTEPPYYEWIVNEKPLKFFKEVDIIRQDKFRELCIRDLHILPNRLKDITWTRIVNTALSNVKIKEVNPEDDISPGGMFNEYLTEFLTRRSIAQSKEQILIDRVWRDNEKKVYVFKSKDFMHFLIHMKTFRYFGHTEIQDKLRTMGAVPSKYYISKQIGSVRAWLLPYESLDKFVEKTKIDDFEVDFDNEYDDKPF